MRLRAGQPIVDVLFKITRRIMSQADLISRSIIIHRLWCNYLLFFYKINEAQSGFPGRDNWEIPPPPRGIHPSLQLRNLSLWRKKCDAPLLFSLPFQTDNRSLLGCGTKTDRLGNIIRSLLTGLPRISAVDRFCVVKVRRQNQNCSARHTSPDWRKQMRWMSLWSDSGRGTFPPQMMTMLYRQTICPLA